MSDPDRPHRAMVYPDQTIAELTGKNATLMRALRIACRMHKPAGLGTRLAMMRVANESRTDSLARDALDRDVTLIADAPETEPNGEYEQCPMCQ